MSERDERGAGRDAAGAASNPFAPNRDVLAAVHDRARAAAAAERLGADDDLRSVVAASSAPAPAQPSDRAEHAVLEVRAQPSPHVTASRLHIDPEAIGVVLPSASPHDATFPPRQPAAAIRPAGHETAAVNVGGVAMSTAPGLGEPQRPAQLAPEQHAPEKETLADARGAMPPGSGADPAGSDAGPPGSEPGPPSSIDEAMLQAELKLAEAQNREIYEREKKRRVVDEQTRGQLKKAVPGSKEHFDALALRQKWTLPLDDEDYDLWRQHQMLAEHAGALKNERSAKRIEKAKAVARGPAIAMAVLAVVGALVGVGWWLGRAKEAPEAPRTEGARSAGTTVAPADGAKTAAPAIEAAAPAAPNTATPANTATPEGAVAADPASTTASGSRAVGTTAPGTAALGTGKAPGAAPAATPAGTGARPAAPAGGPKKDPWEREF